MKAIVLNAYGDVSQLAFTDVPEPKVGAKDLKVRMAGAGLNPVDTKMRSGAVKDRMPLKLPAVLGRDVSGIVVEIGSDVTNFRVGERVMGLVMGAYAELVVAPIEAFAPVPPKMNLVDAAALPLVLLTGSQLIEEALQPKKGDVVLVTGAMGGVGRTAVYSARRLGATVLAGVRSSQKEDAKNIGADDVFALDTAAEIARLPMLDGIADTVGGELIAKLLAKVKKGGTIGSVVGETAGAKALGLTVRAMMSHPDAPRLEELAIAVDEGKLVVPVVKRLPLSQAREAQTLSEQGVGGKVLLTGAIQA